MRFGMTPSSKAEKNLLSSSSSSSSRVLLIGREREREREREGGREREREREREGGEGGRDEHQHTTHKNAYVRTKTEPHKQRGSELQLFLRATPTDDRRQGKTPKNKKNKKTKNKTNKTNKQTINVGPEDR